VKGRSSTPDKIFVKRFIHRRRWTQREKSIRVTDALTGNYGDRLESSKYTERSQRR